jgi:homogentisate 1,2-dioxygenase
VLFRNRAPPRIPPLDVIAWSGSEALFKYYINSSNINEIYIDCSSITIVEFCEGLLRSNAVIFESRLNNEEC